MKIIIFHGYKSSPKKGFFPWLKDELHKLGHEVIIPELPDPENPDPEEWTKIALEAMPYVDKDTLIIGHSLGATIALRFLEAAEATSPPKGTLLISPPWHIKAEMFRGFFFNELDFDVLAWKSKMFVIVHAKDDKVIPEDHAVKYANVLHGTLVNLSKGGHFQGEKYPDILKLVLKMIDKEMVYEPGAELEDEFFSVR